ncbi:MAG TPA: chitobiase/beta-hexosaminidase C-terminal domain-containing protein, partial [Verrucomicrobiae bacterium]|nr:chitobiase/beta-hexosaminidase C-terminal domain-containing protein [Verrucomicrobiae bacterium]
DGKFDQSELPSDVELEVGRVDLYNMTCFANKTPSLNEIDLLRQYLAKDHNFRHGKFATMRRAGLICDNFGEADGEAYAANGWRNFAPFFKPASNEQVPWGSFFSTLAAKSYMCAYGTGGGAYYTCAGIGSSDDFATTDIKTVFTFFFGSYFGDWDNESSFLRAPLGTKSYTLVSAWAGRPNWFLHPMGIGETIGYCTKLTQNNTTNGLYKPAGDAARGTHVALMGDPTLRLHPVMAPPKLNFSVAQNGITLTWSGTSETNVQGYFVYRANSPEGPFTRISGATPVKQLQFTDSTGTANHTYMVKTVKLEISPSASYYNLSQGIFGSMNSGPAAPSNLVATPGQNSISLTWTDNSANESGFSIYRRAASEATFAKISDAGANVVAFNDAVTVGTGYTYKVRAWNSVGESAFSNEATSQAATASSATFVGVDANTSGTWKGAYGEEGFSVIGDSAAYPAYVDVTASGNQSWVWDWSTTDAAALQRPGDETRLAACWYASTAFDVTLSFKDTATHRVAFYFLDWDEANRSARVDVLDGNSGAALLTRTISGFANGVYLVWDLAGKIKVRITPTQGNAVLSGIFFDSPSPRAQAPTISPAAGSFTDSVQVTISAEAGAQIRYTMDGTDPQSTSTLYSGAFTLTNSATVKARAYKNGMRESLVASAAYKIVSSATPSASVQFVGSNSSLGGSWKGAYGAEGYVLIADATVKPSYAQVNVSGAQQWIWEYATSDLRAVQRASDSSRVAPCWYSSTSFDVDVNFTGTTAHTLTFYCLDWDNGGRAQRIDVIDYDTKRVLDSRDVTNFSGGVYLSYRLQGRVIVRFTRTQSYNAVVSGIFFDAAK